MPHRIQNGLIEYLEIMHLAGVTEIDRCADFSPPVRPAELVEQDPPVGLGSVSQNQDTTQPPVPESSIESVAVSPQPEIEMNKSEKIERLKLLAEEVSRCSLCRELALARTQTVFGVGNPNAKLVFLGEAPGADEDKQGEPFVGRAGKLLDDIITKGMKLERKDVYICNILRCRPPGNRNPLPEEAANCRSFLDRTLEIVKPKFICCLGSVAAQNLLGTDQTIGSMRGKILDYHGIRVVCTYHPAYLLRNPPAKKSTWDDIKILMKEMGLPID